MVLIIRFKQLHKFQLHKYLEFQAVTLDETYINTYFPFNQSSIYVSSYYGTEKPYKFPFLFLLDYYFWFDQTR